MSTVKPPGYDDRFVVPLEASRRGAHRARVNPLIAALPVMAITFVAIGVVVVGWTLLGGNSTSSSGPSTEDSVPATASGTPSGSASGGPSASGSPSASASPSGSSRAQVDRTIPVTVANATKIDGLAAKAKAKLVSAEWEATVSYSSGQAGLPTMIYYGASSQSATAQQVANDLGIGTVKKSSIQAGSGIAVVVGEDFAELIGAGG